jgi:uncharacterized protein (TIGR03546 family)
LLSGFLGFVSPLNLIVLLVVFLLRVNLSAYFLGSAFFSGIAYLLDPLFHCIGLQVLTASALKPLWTALYNSSVWRLQRFNNTVVMGGIVVGLLGFIPFLLLSNVLIRKYRDHVLVWVRKTRVMQFFLASRLYSIYQKVSG